MTRIIELHGDLTLIEDPSVLYPDSDLDLNKTYKIEGNGKILYYKCMKFGDIDRAFIDYVKESYYNNFKDENFRIFVMEDEDDYCL